MNILLDSCVWGGAKEVLETAGYNTKWVGNLTQYGQELQKGAIITVEKNRVRIRSEKS